MPTYPIHAVTIGSFHLGEADKVLTLFSAERGIVRAVAKGARKPKAKIAGRSDVLNVNKLLVATGRSLDIITQAETIATFGALRKDLERLSYSLYYAELTQHFGNGVADESVIYFEFLVESLRRQADGEGDAAVLCLEFELHLLEMLGYKPELDACVACRDPLTDYTLAAFHYELGGIVCERCFSGRGRVAELSPRPNDGRHGTGSTHITPLVWKRLVLAAGAHEQHVSSDGTPGLVRANQAARRIVQGYIEHRAGRRMRSLDLIGQL